MLAQLLRCVWLLAVTVMTEGWRWQSGYAPLRLVPCIAGNFTQTQQFRLAANGTVLSPTRSRVGPAYCLSVLVPKNETSLDNAAVVAADCGDPRFGLQLWQQQHPGRLVPRDQPNSSSPLCFGVQSQNRTGTSEGLLLPNCSSVEAQFDIGFPSASTGTIVHRASGLCVTVGPCAPAPNPNPAGSSQPEGTAPCDIFGNDGVPCVAAHSTVRALYGAFAGALYNVTRSSDNASTGIPVLAAGGYANSSVQDEFCAGVECVISVLFDQSPHGNDLLVFHDATRQDRAANASADRHTVGGHAVYSLYVEPGVGYRTKPGAASGVALGEEPESMYMVFDGRHYNDR
eukprot:COSAG05_NODE_2675_length_2779_cov_1.849254_2_plen_343_part_00